MTNPSGTDLDRVSDPKGEIFIIKLRAFHGHSRHNGKNKSVPFFGMPAHVMQRGHNRDPVFFSDQDYLEYLRCLKHAADASGCQVHAYVLMTNHVHLLVTPETKASISQLFQGLGRHKGHIIQSQAYLLSCMRYIEMNPVRTGMVDHPAQYRWSSYPANALGVSHAIVQHHAEYIALSASAKHRQKAYQALFDENLEGAVHGLFRQSLQSGTPLGNDRFKAQVEAAIGKKIGWVAPGRPKKKPDMKK